MIFKDLDRIVFAGDSITDMESTQPVGDGSLWNELGRGYVRHVDNMLAAYYPEVRVRITNSGVNGHTSTELLQRFNRDVISLNPQWISILIGGNDVWRQFDSPASPDTWVLPDEYRSNLEKMLAMSYEKEGVKGVFVMSPYYMEPLKEDPLRVRMVEYATIAKEVADKFGATYVDLQSMFDKYFKYRHNCFIAWDRMHPNHIGSLLIAKEFLSYCDFDPLHTFE